MQKTTLFSTSRRRSLRPFVHVMESFKKSKIGQQVKDDDDDGVEESCDEKEEKINIGTEKEVSESNTTDDADPMNEEEL